jgi:DNA-binding transcriptional LysR family regulator
VDWDGLRVFLAVARHGRVSAAARRLGVEHTTVSRRLAALERELGVALFHRTASGYRLTPDGQNAMANAEAMERAALAVGARAREQSGMISGRVRLAMVPELASHWLSLHLVAFRALYPDLDLQVLVGTRQRDLSRGEAELVVQSPRPRQVGLVASRIGRMSLALYASKGLIGDARLWIESAESARNWPLLAYTAPFQMLQGAKWFQPVFEASRIVLETNSTHSLLAAARVGLGIAVLPRLVARTDDDLVRVSDDVANHDMWLIAHSEVRRDPKVRATADFLKRIAVGPGGLC